MLTPMVHSPKESSLNSRSIQDNRILLVVPRIAQDSHNTVDAGGQFSETQVLHTSRGDQGFVRVVQHVRKRVHAHVEVGDVHAHGLFTHSTLKNGNNANL